MLSRAREEDDSDSNDGGGIATKEDEGKENEFFETDSALLHCTREVWNVMTSILGCKAQQANVREQAVDF